jgi:teichuronic acid exporter
MSGLAAKAKSAVLWNAGFNLLRDGLQFITMLVMARLLLPAAYGQFGFVTNLVGFISIFGFNNFIGHSLQVKSDTDANFQDHFTAGAILNGGMFVITNLAAIAVRWWPDAAPVQPFLHVMSLTFLLEWPCEVRRKMIERSMDWKTLRVLHTVGLLMTAGLAIGMGMTGCGTYALLIPGMAVTLPFTYNLFVTEKWRPHWSWSWERYRAAFHFACSRIGSGLALYGRQLLESSVLLAVFGFTAVGILNRSVGLAQMFCGKIASQLVYAIYPILTRIEESEGNAARVGGLVIQTVAWISIPLAVAFGMLSAPVIKLIYGSKWLEVIPVLPVAMTWGVVSALYHASYMLLLARSKPRTCFVADLLLLVGTGISLGVALPHGLGHYLLGSTLAQAVAWLFILVRLKHIHAITQWGWIRPIISAAFSSAVAVGALQIYCNYRGLSHELTVIQAIVWGSAFFFLYGLVLRIVFSTQLVELIAYFPLQSLVRKILWLPAKVNAGAFTL